MVKEKKKDKEKKKISLEQMLEALRQQKVMESLSEPKGINELQYSLSKTEEDVPSKLISKSAVSKKLKRLEKQGLVTQHREHVEFEKLASPKYRGWRNIKEYDNGSKDLEFGFELTSNGKRAFEILKENIEPLEETKSKKPKKED
jgi:DNA-binding HxlR family transcriptional regulator